MDRAWVNNNDDVVHSAAAGGGGSRGYPWKDTTGFYPESGLPPGIAYGMLDGDTAVGGLHSTCYNGWQGVQDATGDFMTCHHRIKVPTWFEENTITFIIVFCLGFVVVIGIYLYLRRVIRQRYLLAKAERRRSRKSSETNPTGRN